MDYAKAKLHIIFIQGVNIWLQRQYPSVLEFQMVAGALIALFLPQYDMEIASTIEFIGSLIGTLCPFQIRFQSPAGVNLVYHSKNIRKDIRQDVQREFLSHRKSLHPLWK